MIPRDYTLRAALRKARERLIYAERELLAYELGLEPGNPRHERTLRKLKEDVELARADAHHAKKVLRGDHSL